MATQVATRARRATRSGARSAEGPTGAQLARTAYTPERMKRLRALLERLTGRPAEADEEPRSTPEQDAEELRREALEKDLKKRESGQPESDRYDPNP